MSFTSHSIPKNLVNSTFKFRAIFILCSVPLIISSRKKLNLEFGKRNTCSRVKFLAINYFCNHESECNYLIILVIIKSRKWIKSDKNDKVKFANSKNSNPCHFYFFPRILRSKKKLKLIKKINLRIQHLNFAPLIFFLPAFSSLLGRGMSTGARAGSREYAMNKCVD